MEPSPPDEIPELTGGKLKDARNLAQAVVRSSHFVGTAPTPDPPAGVDKTGTAYAVAHSEQQASLAVDVHTTIRKDSWRSRQGPTRVTLSLCQGIREANGGATSRARGSR